VAIPEYGRHIEWVVVPPQFSKRLLFRLRFASTAYIVRSCIALCAFLPHVPLLLGRPSGLAPMAPSPRPEGRGTGCVSPQWPTCLVNLACH
jgi:hypothetical protein